MLFRSMALATSLWRESLARSCLIHLMKSSTSGAMSLRRAVRRSRGVNPLIERSSMKIASIFWTASKAIGEITGFVLPRAVEAMSASSKNLRLA